MTTFPFDDEQDRADELPERMKYCDDSELRLTGDEPRPIERPCSSCGKPYHLSLEAAAEIDPGSAGDICDECLQNMAARGRKLLDSDQPVTD